MTITKFAPKGDDVLRSEVEGVFAELGLEADINKDLIDKITSLRSKDETFKASLHADKQKHLDRKNYYKEMAVKAGLIDAKTGKTSKEEKSEYVTKADLEKLSHRQKYAYLQDDEYDLIQSRASKYDNDFDKTMKEDSIVSSYMKTIDVKGRLDRVNVPPSTRIAPDKTGSLTDEQREFARKCGNDPDKVYN